MWQSWQQVIFIGLMNIKCHYSSVLCLIHLLHFQVCSTSGSVIPCLAAAPSKKSKKYFITSGGSSSTWNIALNRSSIYFWSVPWNQEKNGLGFQTYFHRYCALSHIAKGIILLLFRKYAVVLLVVLGLKNKETETVGNIVAFKGKRSCC